MHIAKEQVPVKLTAPGAVASPPPDAGPLEQQAAFTGRQVPARRPPAASARKEST